MHTCKDSRAEAQPVKGEDLAESFSLSINDQRFSIHLIADGHGGRKAAEHVIVNFKPTLASRLAALGRDYYPEGIRKALCLTFLSLEKTWRALPDHDSSGTTLTCLLISSHQEGSLLTVANVGDSESFLDTGISILELTRPHNLEMNPKERERLASRPGYSVAPLAPDLKGPAIRGQAGVGPSRVWLEGSPFGLCVSRSIGDEDVGDGILAFPHLSQVVLPANRASRVILASDGLWDLSTFSSAAKAGRKAMSSPAAAIINSHFRFMDDTTVLMVDLLPKGVGSFVEWIKSPGVKAACTRNQDQGCMSCFQPVMEMNEPDCCEFQPGSLGHLSYLACLDSYTVYPEIRSEVNLMAMDVEDIAIHGGQISAIAPEPPNLSPILSPSTSTARSGTLRFSMQSISRIVTGRRSNELVRADSNVEDRSASTRLQLSFSAKGRRKSFRLPGALLDSHSKSSRLGSAALPLQFSPVDQANALLETKWSIRSGQVTPAGSQMIEGRPSTGNMVIGGPSRGSSPPPELPSPSLTPS